MAANPTNDETLDALRRALTADEYHLNERESSPKPGPDIVANKDGEAAIFIEVIGYKSKSDARGRDFWNAFAGALIRIGGGAKRAPIAVPAKFNPVAGGLKLRAQQRGDAWRRLGRAFPELEIWLVDPKDDSYQVSKWNDWLDTQD